MKGRIFKYLNMIRYSFWFVPILMALGAVGLAYGTVAIEGPLTTWLNSALGWKFNGGAEGAAAVLGNIAGSMITIAGVVFSMTLVALSLTVSNLGPRLLRNFMRDRSTQVVLGTFVATFLYCLLVLRTIRRQEEILFIPHFAVSLGVLFAVLSVGVLIYFIHHVARSIQANEIVAQLSRELNERIGRLFPEAVGEGAPRVLPEDPDPLFLETFESQSRPVGARDDGYLQFVDKDVLLAVAAERDLVLRLEHRTGQYVVFGQPLVRVWPGERVDDGLADRISFAFTLGIQRTPSHDLEFVVDQLVEIAVRALSPGVNDPFTAIVCIDRLGSSLCRLAQRKRPSPYLHDEGYALRVIAPGITFSSFADAAFNQIRQYGRSSAAVTIRLLETLAVAAEFATLPEDLETLQRHGDMVIRGAREGLPEEKDRQEAEERYDALCRVINEKSGG